MSSSPRRPVVPLIIMLVIALGMMSLSTYYLYRALLAYSEKSMENAIYYTVIGTTGLAVTGYMMFILTKRPMSRKAAPPVMSIVECLKCGFKSIRRFTKGDYVFKNESVCQKCNEPMLITAIYAEEAKKK